ncbi:MAG TPA: aspartate-semialdehyde dehydrogenase [Methylomirabilota bacterium]|nr:aspartate-semialdehyde dehydrogenase [Methylomirabilota bacterium]
MSYYRVAIVGATGAVGQTLLKLLEERKFPIKALRCVASERSIGKSVAFSGESLRVEPLSEETFQGVEIAFFSAGAARSLEWAPKAARAGAIVIDNSSAFRMDPQVPLVVPEINPHDLRQHRGIIANPNCTTIVMVMGLKPIQNYARILRVVATSYQAVSGAGAQAVEELRRQTLAWSKGEPMEVRVFPHRIAFNLLPHIDAFLDNGYTKEEMKLVNETRKILGDPTIQVAPTTVRVPVFTAHSVAVRVETERKVSASKARELFQGFPGLRLWDDPRANRYPMPILAEGQDDCFVGRIREDLSLDHGLLFWIVGDQLRKGAATNAIQIAEQLIQKEPRP